MEGHRGWCAKGWEYALRKCGNAEDCCLIAAGHPEDEDESKMELSVQCCPPGWMVAQTPRPVRRSRKTDSVT